MDRREFIKTTTYCTGLLAAPGLLYADFEPVLSHPFEPKHDSYDCELLIVGGSSAGTAAALTAGRLGLDTVLVMRAPRDLGGLPTNGLNPDSDMPVRCIGGFALEMDVLGRVATGLEIEDTKYVVPPHEMFEYFLREFEKLPNVTILADYYPAAVHKDGTQVTGVLFRHRKDVAKKLNVNAKITIDAEIEGDVAYLSGVEMTLKREGKVPSDDPTRNMEYSAGEIYTPIRGALGGGEPLPQSTFKADEVARTMGWSGMLVLERHETKSPDNPWVLTVPPAGYNKKDYEWVKGLGGVKLGKNHYRFSADIHSSFVEGWKLPDGRHCLESMNIADREAIERKHQARLLCVIYYAQHELGHTHWGLSSKTFREGMPAKYTLADYGTTTKAGNVPLASLIYMREGRRMVNDHVLGGKFMEDQGTEALYQKDYWHPRSFYFNAMNIDIHGVTHRTVEGSGPEGLQVPRFINPNYGVCCIPFDVCIPRPKEATGLLVASAGAYTHQAYSAFPRMEPGRFQIGAGCAHAAAVALRDDVLPHETDIEKTQLLGLSRTGQGIVYFDDAMPGSWGHTIDQMLGARGVPLHNAQGTWISETEFSNAQAVECLKHLFLTYAEKPVSKRTFKSAVKPLAGSENADSAATIWGTVLPAVSKLAGFTDSEAYETLFEAWRRAGFINADSVVPAQTPLGFADFKRLLFNVLYAEKSPEGPYPVETGDAVLRDTFNRADESLQKPEYGMAYRAEGGWKLAGGSAVPENSEADSLLWAGDVPGGFIASCDLFLEQTQTEACAGLALLVDGTDDLYRFVLRTDGFDVLAQLEKVRGTLAEILLSKRLQTMQRGFTLRLVRSQISLRCALGHEFIGNHPLPGDKKITAVGLFNAQGRANHFNNFEIIRRG